MSDLRLVGAHNFRDLGGLPTVDGRRTLRGRMFRSDHIGHLTPEDLDLLRAYSIRTIVDLRARGEIDRDGIGPLAESPVEYVNYPVFPDPTGVPLESFAIYDEDLGAAYLEGLEGSREAAAAALERMGAPGACPLVFHCNAGKDRTGVLAALILGCIGVTVDAIVADYAVTAERMEPILARYATDPRMPKAPDGGPLPRMGALPGTMQRFLNLLDERFGGARSWMLDAGVSPAAIEGLEAALLDG